MCPALRSAVHAVDIFRFLLFVVFVQAGVLFNLAAMHSREGTRDKRQSEDGLKAASQSFRVFALLRSLLSDWAALRDFRLQLAYLNIYLAIKLWQRWVFFLRI